MALRVLWQDEKTDQPARTLDVPAGLDIRFAADEAEAVAMRDWPAVLVAGNPSAEQLAGANLERVVVPFAGIAARLRETALSHGQIVVHNSHYNGAMVAQHALALLLACANRVVAADRLLRSGDWGSDTDPRSLGLNLQGKVALLLGFGSIGRALLAPLQSLGMEVRTYRRNPRPNSQPPSYGRAQLSEALKVADVVIVSLPATPATVGLLGASELALLKEDAILVNVGRGKVIDEEALYQALQSGGIRAAGIDVWYQYPKGEGGRRNTLPSRFPFQDLANVVMTPHSANDVVSWRLAAASDVMKTLAALTRGELRNVVDLESGY